MALPAYSAHVWHRRDDPHTGTMRRRLALLAAIALCALTGCQSDRAQTEGSTRLSQPTMSSPSTVVHPSHQTDAPRYQMYDPF